jgi:hypothetical protein
MGREGGPEAGAVRVPTPGELLSAPIAAASGVAEGVGAVERGWASVMSAAAGNGAKVVLATPGSGRPVSVAKWVAKWFVPERELVSKKYAETRDLGEGRRDVAREEGRYFGKNLGKELADATPDERDALYQYLGSEADAPPPGLSPKALALAQRGSALVDEGRRALVAMGRRSADALHEYPRFLTRFMQNVDLAERARRSPSVGGRGSLKLPEQFSRQDAYEIRLDLPKQDVEDVLLDVTLPVQPKYVGEFQGETLVKFPDSPEGMAARDDFFDHLKGAPRGTRKALREVFDDARKALDRWDIKSRKELNAAEKDVFDQIKGAYEKARDDLFSLEGTAIREGSVKDARMFGKSARGLPTTGSLNLRTADPLSPEMRALMGEDRDPATALARTIANVRGEVAHAEMLQAIYEGADEHGPWVREATRGPRGPGGVQKPDDPPKGWTHVTNSRLGPLHDTWVRDDVWKDLKGVYGSNPGDQSIMQNGLDFARGMTDAFKTWLTIRNPANQAQNWISYPTTAIEAGLSPFNPDNAAHVAEAVRQIRNPDPFDPMQREIIEGGIDRGANMAPHELGRVDDVWANEHTSPAYKWGRTMLDPFWWSRRVQAADRRLGAAYSLADRIIRRAAYMKNRADGMTPAEAVRDVDASTTNYAKQGRFVREMRHLPLSPFITYAYSRYRVLAHNVAKHPIRAAFTLFGAYALQQLVEATLGDDVTDEEKAAAHAEYGKSRWGWFGNQYTFVVGRNEDGSPRVMDAGPFFTTDKLVRGPEDALDDSAIESSTDWLAGKVMGLAAGPVYEQMIAQTTGRDLHTGKSLLDWKDRASSASKSLAPPFFPNVLAPFTGAVDVSGSKMRKIVASAKGEQFAKTKPPISLRDALIDAMLHVRIDGYVPQQSMDNLLMAADREDARLGRLFDRSIDAEDQAGQDDAAKDTETLWDRYDEKYSVHEKAEKRFKAGVGAGK